MTVAWRMQVWGKCYFYDAFVLSDPYWKHHAPLYKDATVGYVVHMSYYPSIVAAAVLAW